MKRAIERGRYDYAPWVGAMFAWNLNFSVTGGKSFPEQDETAGFSMLNSDWSPRPAYTAHPEHAQAIARLAHIRKLRLRYHLVAQPLYISGACVCVS